jgi:hypothetical protein
MTKPGSTDSTLRPGWARVRHSIWMISSEPLPRRIAISAGIFKAVRRASRNRVPWGSGIAVDVHDRQLLQPFPPQALRQAVGVLHGIQLDEPGGVGDVIGRQRQDFGADQTFDQVLHRRAPGP